MTMVQKLRDFFDVLLTPGCWIQENPYSEMWDWALNRAMESHSFVEMNAYHATLGEWKIWTHNHPYASFTITIDKGTPIEEEVRPKRSTILRARKKLLKDFLQSQQAKIMAGTR